MWFCSSLEKLPLSEYFMILVIEVTGMYAQSLTVEVGIRYRSHDLVGEEFKMLRMSISDTGLMEDRALLMLLLSSSGDRQ